MRYRQLGSSDLQVSEIALGSWLTYGLGVDDSAARACVDKAFEVGVTTKPKADHLGMGLAIARRAAHSLGGQVSLSPREGGGASFELRWPGRVG